jgi:hypothetical protein
MDSSVFDRETLLDLSVNIIPLGIITFFAILFVVAPSFEFDPFIVALQMGLLIVPFLALALVTYYSGRAVAEDEGKLESANETE